MVAINYCIDASAQQMHIRASVIRTAMISGQSGKGLMHLSNSDLRLAKKAGFSASYTATPCGNIQAGAWLIAAKRELESTKKQKIQACLIRSSKSFNVASTAIIATIRYTAYHPNAQALGVMGIPVNWTPILRAAGFSTKKIASDPCTGIEAGTFILAFQNRWLAQNTQHGSLDVAPHYGILPPANLIPVIQKYCTEYKVPYDLVVAIINRESGFNAKALSNKGAIGYMQLIPSTAADFGVDPWNPIQNLKGGIEYLSTLLRKFNNNTVLAVAGYNAGGNAVVRWGYKIPPYAQTQAYVPAVLSIYKYLKEKS
jgi:soluble lytic murein transglycosylase-like protein